MAKLSIASRSLGEVDDSESALEYSTLLSEIRELRAELQRRRGGSMSEREVRHDGEGFQIKIALDRAVGERKPFVLRCHGLLDFELKVSTMRAALLLGLLLDLHDRSAGGTTFGDIASRMALLYRALDGTSASEEQVASLVRVGLYRLELSLEDENIFAGACVAFKLNPKTHRLDLAANQRIQRVSDLSVSVSSSDPKILASIDSLSATSPLARARRQKSMYISSGEKGWDQLFLEFFNHNFSVCNTSLFYRPALATFPDGLLKAIGATGASVLRKRVTLEGFRSGRVELRETLNRQTLWEMMTCDTTGRFYLYPPGVKTEHVKAHYQEMISHIRTYPGYQLALTDAVFPFIVGVVEIGSAADAEFFTMFYRQPQTQIGGDLTCFVLHDSFVAQSVLARVISTVAEHPSTVTDRDLVVVELERMIEYLDTHGPLVK